MGAVTRCRHLRDDVNVETGECAGCGRVLDLYEEPDDRTEADFYMDRKKAEREER